MSTPRKPSPYSRPADPVRDALEARVSLASRRVRELQNSAPRGPMGLTAESVKASPEYQTAKREFETVFAALRQHNAARRKATP